jgi:hypothetical protein
MDNYGNIGPNSTALNVHTADCTPPSIVGNLLNISRNATTVVLNWTAATDSGSGVWKYLVFRNGSNIGNATDTNYSDATVAPNSFYRYNVSAIDNYNNRGANVSIGVITLSVNLTVILPPGTAKYVLNATNATGTFYPINQTLTQPIYRVNNTSEGAVTLTLRLNASLPTCMQAFFQLNSTWNISRAWNVSTATPVTLVNLNINQMTNLWNFVIYNNCTPGTVYNRKFIFGIT